MKSKKIKVLSFAIVAALLQSTCVYAADSKDKYTRDDLNNIEPGFSSDAINKSKYKIDSSVNNYSSQKTQKEVEQELGDDSSKSTKNDSSTSAEASAGNAGGQNIIVATQPSTGVKGSYWGKTSNKKWMLFEQNMPVVGWKKVSGVWYYMDLEGIMQTGWINDGSSWYYLYPSGAMAYNTYVDGYYLDWNGVMQ
ncbi:cell wall-binding protein [Clostridium sp. C2-6-12]|uniref:cell wall-binding protein n=1 Tax=Clostridium sp. C2-6-12 TaxID=2698832 RepID=UPI00136E602B|nr:cell wall-binding protein [Clostridium sp. C2-6-12]